MPHCRLDRPGGGAPGAAEVVLTRPEAMHALSLGAPRPGPARGAALPASDPRGQVGGNPRRRDATFATSRGGLRPGGALPGSCFSLESGKSGSFGPPPASNPDRATPTHRATALDEGPSLPRSAAAAMMISNIITFSIV